MEHLNKIPLYKSTGNTKILNFDTSDVVLQALKGVNRETITLLMSDLTVYKKIRDTLFPDSINLNKLKEEM